MPLNSCLVAAHVRRWEDRAVVDERIDALAQWYGAIDVVQRSVRHVPEPRLILAVLRFDDRLTDLRRTVSWGNPVPDELSEPEALLTATDDDLRRLDGPLALVAATKREAAICVAAGGVTSLYEAHSSLASVWSSHAVAAGWAAFGKVTVDSSAVAELISADFVGDTRTLIGGVRAVQPASRIQISAGDPRSSCFWPPRERWAPLDPDEASAEAEIRFLQGLERRLRESADAKVGLTAGLDSRTVVVALRELGVDFTTFSFGDPGSEDARGARQVAGALGVPHEHGTFVTWEDGDVVRRLHADARWSEGCAPLAPGEIEWPAEMSHWVPGIGAETGRAFYYRWLGPGQREPSAAVVARTGAMWFEGRIVGGPRHVGRAARRRVRRWVDEAMTYGCGGWSALDVVYAEQRVMRWGRGMLPRLPVSLVPAFATPDLLQALASLPLSDRLDDGFQRRFIAAREPALVPPAPGRPGQPPLLALGRAVARIELLRARRSLGVRRRAPAPASSKSGWQGIRAYADWIADAVVSSDLLSSALGDGWLREIQRGYMRGDPGAERLVHLAAGPVALAHSLHELGRHRATR